MDFLTGLLLFFLALLGFCAWRIRAQGLSLATAKRCLLYIFMALLMIAACLGAFYYADSKGIDEELTVKWMNIIIPAAFVFGFPR